MNIQPLTESALSLPLAERVALAQSLWQSIDAELPEATDEQVVMAQVLKRDQELSTGQRQGKPHKDVMQGARRALR